MVQTLEAGVFSTPIRLPAGSPFRGIRLGTASVTRRGLGEADMKQIAVFIRKILLDDERPMVVAREVATFASSFGKVHFCFD